MLSPIERGCLVIADITGYTGYLAGSELDHAQDVLADLSGTVVTAIRPVLRLASSKAMPPSLTCPRGSSMGPCCSTSWRDATSAFGGGCGTSGRPPLASATPASGFLLSTSRRSRTDGEFVRQRMSAARNSRAATFRPPEPASDRLGLSDVSQQTAAPAAGDRPGSTRRIHGHRGPGTTTHCVHGRDAIVEEILDWRPFEHFTVRFVLFGLPIDETAERGRRCSARANTLP